LKNSSFLPLPRPRIIESKRLIFDPIRNLYKVFNKENADVAVSLGTFQNIKKNLNCTKAKGLVDACPLCVQDKNSNSYKEHINFAIKNSRVIRNILNSLPECF
jgi:hypothetical protein